MTQGADGSYQKYYLNLVGEEEFAEIFNLMGAKKMTVRAWPKGEKACIYRIEEIDLETRKLVLGRKTHGVDHDYNNQSVFIKIGQGDNQYFTHTKLHCDSQKQKYWIYLTEDLYQTQQRFDYRLQATAFNEIRFKIETDDFEGVDVSLGGVSFLVPKNMSERFGKGLVFHNCTLKVDQEEFEIPYAKVARTWEEEETIKVGVSFKLASETKLFQIINLAIRRGLV